MNGLFPAPIELPQGVFRTGPREAEWRVWAPLADTLSLVLWRSGRECVMPMHRQGDGYFVHRVTGVENGLRYAFRFPDGATRPDPASRWQPDGIHAPSAVFFPPDDASRTDWSGVPLRELVIYELHVGTFTPAGTFDAIIPRLEQLVELGITAIELMPIAQFPGTRNWGYDGVHLYAAQNSYGGPQGLLRLIEAAHDAGLGVILDVVYNHLGPEGNYVGEFGPYYCDRHHTPWGRALNYDGPDCGPVRRFVIENAVSWVRDFGLDGLRLDAIQTIYDLSARHVLAELQDEVQAVARDQQRAIHVIGETNQNDARLVEPAERGGYGLSGIWADDLHHSLHALLTGQRDGYYVDFGRAEHVAKVFNDSLVYDGCYSRYRRSRHGNQMSHIEREKLVVCIQNHDQVGNRPRGDRLSTLVSEPQLRLAAALMLVSPFTPLLFMGEEYGESAPFPFFCSFLDEGLNASVRRGRRQGIRHSQFQVKGKLPDPASPATFESARLSWQWHERPAQASLRHMYQRLLQARQSWAPLREQGGPTATILELPTRQSDERGISEVLQVTYGDSSELVVLANLSASWCDFPAAMSAGELLFSTTEGTLETSPRARDGFEPFELIVLDASRSSRQ